MEEEKWLPVPGFDGYEVSNKGRVRSFCQRNKPGHILAHGRGGKGHHVVRLRNKMKSVHRLVLLVHGGESPPGRPLALHRDGNVDHNYIENLYWGTYSDNLNDSVRHGTHQATRRTHCKRYGHPIDGVALRPDGTVRQRYCTTCAKRHLEELRQKRPKVKSVRPPLLTEEQVAAIKADTRSLRAIAADYGISHTTVRKVCAGLYG